MCDLCVGGGGGILLHAAMCWAHWAHREGQHTHTHTHTQDEDEEEELGAVSREKLRSTAPSTGVTITNLSHDFDLTFEVSVDREGGEDPLPDAIADR
jgi:hypothetical protein